MPIGSLSGFAQVMHHLSIRRPRSVLDLGAGMGMYGAGIRQWLDLGGYGVRTRLVGVEGFVPYKNPCWELYDVMLPWKIEVAVTEIGTRFDAVILGDVIEHMEKPDGEALLGEIDRFLLEPRGVLFVVTPAIWMEQAAAHGNELERHRSLWSADDFRRLGFKMLLDGSCDQFASQMLAAYRDNSCETTAGNEARSR